MAAPEPRRVQFLVEGLCSVMASGARASKPFPVWVLWPATVDPDDECQAAFYRLAAPEEVVVMYRHGLFYDDRFGRVYGVCEHMGHVIE